MAGTAVARPWTGPTLKINGNLFVRFKTIPIAAGSDGQGHMTLTEETAAYLAYLRRLDNGEDQTHGIFAGIQVTDTIGPATSGTES